MNEVKKRFKQFGFFNIFIILTVIFLPLYILRFSIFSIPSTALEVLIYITFLAGLLEKKIKIKFDLYFFVSLFFVVTALISVFVDPQFIRSSGIFKAYFIDGFLIFLTIRYGDRESIKLLPACLVVSGALTASASLVMFAFGTSSSDGRLLDLDRLSPNYLTMFLVPIFIIGFHGLIKNFRASGKFLFYLTADVLIFVAIILSGSRGAYLALPVGLAMVCAQFIAKKYLAYYKLFAVLFSIVLIAGVLWVFRPNFGAMGRVGNSSNIRYYIWTTSIEIAEERPLAGVGLSNFQDYFTDLTRGRINYSEYIAPQALTAHNLFFHIYLTMGLLGITSFILMLYFFLKNSRDPVIVSALSSILIYGIVDTPFFRNDLSILFWILLGLL
ncbi:MAG: O-Antigen ligase [candidate division WS2 bacterium ADurb.Bin280]|uniref:O-Antigen ligase n=1 Tax=candidate division WS2 bacterium ADurb.Bin280 TaxID=1852829 RepID=A0A1V5SD70_9BACT|nr:MAG: O-Antigen ligase [candidate division WS2 bacterium ADurb.Bin280]